MNTGGTPGPRQLALESAAWQELNYPSLEAARAKLVKHGYALATVEVRPDEGGFKDVVVSMGGER